MSDSGTERHKERKRRSKRKDAYVERPAIEEGRSNKERGGIFVRGREKEERMRERADGMLLQGDPCR